MAQTRRTQAVLAEDKPIFNKPRVVAAPTDPQRKQVSGLLPNFDETLSAYAEAMVERKQGKGQAQEPHPGGKEVDAVAAFLKAVHSGMPDYLRLPFRLLTLWFAASSLLTTGKPFHRLDLTRRIARIETWERSRLEPCRRLMEFYGSLALFCLYSELYGQDYEYGTR